MRMLTNWLFKFEFSLKLFFNNISSISTAVEFQMMIHKDLIVVYLFLSLEAMQEQCSHNLLIDRSCAHFDRKKFDYTSLSEYHSSAQQGVDCRFISFESIRSHSNTYPFPSPIHTRDIRAHSSQFTHSTTLFGQLRCCNISRYNIISDEESQ